MSEMTPEEILARRLDQVLPPDTTRIPPQTPDPLVNMAARLAAMSVPEPSDLALIRMENVVLAAFDKQHRVQQQPKQTRRWVSHVSRWAVAASFVLVLLIVGLVPASAGSLPGDPLYGVMRLTESVELALASDSNTAVRLRLVYAERRALEALALFERDQFDAALLDEARAELSNAEQAASPEVRTSLIFQWQQQELSELITFVEQQVQEPDEPVVVATDSATPTDTSTATDTSMPSATPTQTDDPTATDTSTPSATPSATPTQSVTPRPSRTPRPTSTIAPSLTVTPRPSRTLQPTQIPNVATDCPGNSCNSAGVPGGQIDPQNPPGQSGGRDDNPPDPPGQGNPGGGQGGGGGQGNSGNSGGGAPAQPPPSDSGGNSGGGGAPPNPPGQGNPGGGQGGGGGRGN